MMDQVNQSVKLNSTWVFLNARVSSRRRSGGRVGATLLHQIITIMADAAAMMEESIAAER